MKNGNPAIGLVLIFLGGIFLLYNQIFDVNLFSMSTMWPMFILGPGLIFEMVYLLTRRAPGLLVPGGIFTAYGMIFFFQTFTGWHFISYTWPLFILPTAVGLYQLYLAIGRPKGLLIPVAILSAITGVLLSFTLLYAFNKFINFGLLIPLILIVTGIYITFFRGVRTQI